MKNIDIDEWLLDNELDPLEEIKVGNNGETIFLSDILEKHLKEQFAINVVMQAKPEKVCECGNEKRPEISHCKKAWLCKSQTRE